MTEAFDWFDWMLTHNVKLQPVIDIREPTKWVASLVVLAGDGWTNIVRTGSPQGRGASPLEALERLREQIDTHG